MAGRGRSRLPQIRSGEGKPRTRSRRADLRARCVRCGIPAENCIIRRRLVGFRLCRRSAAAGPDRQSAALAGHTAAVAKLSEFAELSELTKLSELAKLSGQLSKQRAAPADLRRAVESSDLARAARFGATG